MTGIGPLQKTFDTATTQFSSPRTPGVICVWRTSSSSSIAPNSGRDPGSSTGAANQANRKITSISIRPDPSKAPLRSPAATGLALGAFGKGDPSHTSFSQRPSEIRPTLRPDNPPPRTGRRRGSSSLRVRLSMNREREGKIFQQIDRSFGCRKERRQPKRYGMLRTRRLLWTWT